MFTVTEAEGAARRHESLIAVVASTSPRWVQGCQTARAQYDRCNAAILLHFTTPEAMPDFASYLAQRGTGLAGVVIGFGVRGNPELTVYFEQLVDAVREGAPTNTLDAIQRHFPGVKEVA